jgi:hypothetical protein
MNTADQSASDEERGLLPAGEGTPQARLPSWDDFAGVSERLLLAVSQFTYTLQYVPVFLDADQQKQVANLMNEFIVPSLQDEPECQLYALNVETGLDDSYFAITFGNPVFDFMLQMDPTTITIAKQRTTVRNLLLTAKIMQRISTKLVKNQVDSKYVFAPFGFPLRIIRVAFTWSYNLVLGTHRQDDTEATNDELFSKLARLRGGDAELPLAKLTDGAIKRGDVSVHYGKMLNDKRRNLWMNYEGPWNVTRKDIDLAVGYRMGESGSPFEPGDLTDFYTPFVSYWRDEILRGFFQQLFANCNVSNRP